MCGSESRTIQKEELTALSCGAGEIAMYEGIHGWAGHVARFNDNRWAKRVTAWTPREWTRRQGRPKTRWRDNLVHHLGPVWPRIARDRRLWRQFKEGFLLTE